MGDDGYTYSNETFYMRVDFFTVSPANKNKKKHKKKWNKWKWYKRKLNENYEEKN